MTDAVTMDRRLRLLHRQGRLTHAHFAVGLALLWSCRGGQGPFQVSYKRIASLARVAVSTAKAAVEALRQLGLLNWQRTRLRVRWQGGLANRQGRNIYCFRSVAPESDDRPAIRRQVSKKAGIEEVRWRRWAPCAPIRSVKEQLAILLS